MLKPKNIDEYIAQYPEEIRKILTGVRRIIKENVPSETEEKISYGIPTFFFKKNLVHFGAYKNHIGFYPTSSGMRAFANEISAYKHSKGAVQFPISQPIPYSLIAKIVKFRVKEIQNSMPKKTN
ncbi:MAG TPA: DUF1801 domain-containing protein [Chitinophagaceae bacterium]|nr:DUF1801 domain-containing protein [Chitinophagaceae bacterium]